MVVTITKVKKYIFYIFKQDFWQVLSKTLKELASFTMMFTMNWHH